MQKEKYKVAIETHKFYDTVSISVVAGIITVAGASFLLYEQISNNQYSYLLFIIVCFVMWGLLIVYRKSAYYAIIARNVSADLEINESLNIGVSIVLKNINLDEYKKYRSNKSIFSGIYGAVHLIFVSLLLGLVMASYIVYSSEISQISKYKKATKEILKSKDTVLNKGDINLSTLSTLNYKPLSKH